MNNNLEELSKPVAYKFDHGVMGPGDFKYGTPQMHSAAKDENASPLYSQEYVSALLAELEARDERIAELERANAAQDDHINQQQDRIESLEKTNTGLGRALAVAEKRLSTPVRLPSSHSMLIREDFHSDYRSQMAFKVDEVITALREQGFAVEGDE